MKTMNEVIKTLEENGYWKLPTLPEARNNPLTWDELKQMEGKPVWVEEKPDNEWIGYWNVVKRLETFDDGSESILFISSEYYDEENYGIDWRAYLKERS